MLPIRDTGFSAEKYLRNVGFRVRMTKTGFLCETKGVVLTFDWRRYGMKVEGNTNQVLEATVSESIVHTGPE